MKIGITGGIGSGKSYVCNLLREQGIEVFDCDSAAKQLMRTSPTLRQQLTQLIGRDAYTADDYMADSTHAVQQKSEEHEEETRIIREMQGEALNNLNVVVIEDDPDIMQQICSEIGVYFNTTSSRKLQGFTI